MIFYVLKCDSTNRHYGYYHSRENAIKALNVKRADIKTRSTITKESETFFESYVSGWDGYSVKWSVEELKTED